MTENAETISNTMVATGTTLPESKSQIRVAPLPTLQQLSPDNTYSAHEDAVKAYWNAIQLATLFRQRGGKKHYFMDGPPFVSGNLHYGHIAVGSFKSAVCNIAGMFGLDPSYILGFDCHGLPIESKVMNVHDLTRDDVEKMGLAEFNRMCDQMITDVSGSWRPLFEKFGRLADFDSPYMTRDLNFMETSIWIFKQLYDKGLVYSGNKVMPYSWALETPLSNFEAGQNYQEILTKSIYVRFEVQADLSTLGIDNDSQVYFIAWTTTPWTLPSNLALCVNADVTYVVVEDLTDPMVKYIVSKNSIANLYGKKQIKKVKILSEFTGKDLDGLHYVPIFPYMADLNARLGRDNSNFFKVFCDPYVKDEGIGTGVVHQAPAFGDDDFRVCSKNGMVDNINISDYCPLDSQCKFTEVVSDYTGLFALDTDDQIRQDLQSRSVVVKVQEYKHNYPHCYRTDTPLVYRTVSSFYINVQPLKQRMMELNATIKWVPEDIGSNRFGNWLETAKDWAVSRFRYYGTPIPIWVNDEDPTDMICVGSIDELADLTGVSRESITDLHPQFVNDLKIVKDGKTYTRVPDIFDCWFESGAVPFGQIHYPFDVEKARELEKSEFLSDFICEGLDQTRGWFYTLLVLSTAILDKAPFKNVVCTGMVMDEHGNKLSKRLKNFEDPSKIIDEIGADYLRIYFIRSPLMRAEPLNFSKTEILRLKNRFVPYINAFRFWIEHTLNYEKQNRVDVKWGNAFQELDMGQEKNIMDRWVLNWTIKICQDVTEHGRNYRMGPAIDILVEAIEGLTNWYLKLNRDRLKGVCGKFEQEASLSTLYTVLFTFTQLWAPFMPFLSEYLFQRLKVIHADPTVRGTESVLMSRFPTFRNSRVDQDVLTQMTDLQRVSQMVRAIRSSSENHTSSMVPFKNCIVAHADPKYLRMLEAGLPTVQAELNVRSFTLVPLKDNVDLEVKIDPKALGREYRGDAKKLRSELEALQSVDLFPLHSGEEQSLTVDIGTDNEPKQVVFEYPNPYFTLVAVPRACLNDSESVYTRIDSDLLVRADPTYDDEINHAYQSRLMHSAIQQARKTMGLRPWNKITVVVDQKFVEACTGDVMADLSVSLPSDSTVLLPGSFGPSDLVGYEMGVTRVLRTSKVFVDKFTWSLLNSDNVEGHIGVHASIE